MVLSFGLGLVYFICLVVGIAVGIGTLVIWVGIPILVVTMITWRFGAGFERWRIRMLEGTTIVAPYHPAPSGGIVPRLRAQISDPASWRDLVYLILLVPVGVAELAIVVTGLALSAGLLAMPVAGPTGSDLGLNGLHVHSIVASLALGILGVPVLVLVLNLFVGVVWVHARGGVLLLGTTGGDRLRERVTTLSDSRSRAVATALDDRRRFERDVHDGAQQRLVALALDLGMARVKMDEDPEAARGLVEEAHEEAKLALAEIRDLVRGIHPAVLTDRGLDAAVSALAARSPVPVTVRVDLPDRPPPAVESAAYFVVAEALTNVAKYSHASSAAVVIERRRGMIVIEISDDGTGAADVAPGGGLSGLADRVAALDGRFGVMGGNGTTVRAELPCES